MSSTTKACLFKAKALLGVALVFNLVVVTGCGQSALFLPESTETLELSADHPLAQQLAGTPFDGATAIQVDRATSNFRLIYPDSNTQLSGKFETTADGQAYVSSFTIGQGGQVVTLNINSQKEITDIDTSAGAKWQRVSTAAPSAPTAPRAPGSKAVTSDVDAYVAANADLVAMAQQIDDQGRAQVGKDTASSFPFAFLALSYVWFAPWGVLLTLYFVFQVVVVLDLVL